MSNELTIPARSTAVTLADEYAPDAELRSGLRRGMIIVAVLVFGFGGLAATLPMAGAVIAPGSVSVATFVKEIGHPTGGVVKEILVKDGDHVREGQVLLRLDDTVSGAAAGFTGENVDQLLARAARLKAERDNLGSVVFPAELTKRAGDPSVAALMQAEQTTFRLRREARQGMVSQLSKRIAETEAEIAGYNAQQASYARQADLINGELKVTRELYEDRYTTLDRLNALERSAVAVSANADSARTSAASAGARIAELRAQAASVQQDARSNSASELMDVQSRISDMRRQKVAADDSYDKSAIRAPQSGVVDKLAIKTIGGVVPPGETIMEIVPDRDRLVVQVRIPISDIDQVHEDQGAVLRFTAFSSRTTPEINGKVTFVSADRTVEPESGIAYYRATVALDDKELRKLGKLKLKPGMPVEAFIQTGNRTMLSYIVKPLSDQLMRAFREN